MKHNEIKLNKNTSKNHQSFQPKKLAQKEFPSSRKLLHEVYEKQNPNGVV